MEHEQQDDGAPKPEFSRVVPLSTLEGRSFEAEWTATDAECAALARRYGIEALNNFTASAALNRVGKGVEARIRFAADVVQKSVISLQTAPQHVEEQVTVHYLPEAEVRAIDARVAEEGFEDEDEDIEPLYGEAIDIGETIAQQLSLALDPYPRQEGEKLEDYWMSSEDAGEPEGRNPFEVLKNLKQNT